MTTTVTVEFPLRLSVKDFAEKIYGNIGGVRNLLFYAETNGFKKCVRRVGKKIFIDVQQYYLWQDEINGVVA